MVYYPLHNSTNGFHFRLKSSANQIGDLQSESESTALIWSHSIRFDLFYNQHHLLTLDQPDLVIPGVYQKNHDPCFSRGIFFNTQQVAANKTWLASAHLSGLFGRHLFNFDGPNLDLGFLLSINERIENGFFVQGSFKVDLFRAVKSSIDFEHQFIRMAEIERRSELAETCPNLHLSKASEYILKKYTKLRSGLSREARLSRSDQVWTRMFSSSNREDFYSVTYFKTNSNQVTVPLVRNFLNIDGEVEGVVVTPNPYDPTLKYYVEINAQGLAYDSTQTLIQITANEIETNYEYSIQTESCWRVYYEFVSSSRWLQGEGEHLYDIEKVLNRVVLLPSSSCDSKVGITTIGATVAIGYAAYEFVSWRVDKMIEAATKMITDVTDKISATIKEILAITGDIHKNLCSVPEAILPHISCDKYGIVKLLQEVETDSGNPGLIHTTFGSTKKQTSLIKINQFGCWQKQDTMKKCVKFKGCKTVAWVRYHDADCMKAVAKTIEYAESEEARAHDMQTEIDENLAVNQGLLWAYDEIQAGNEYISSDEILMYPIEYNFPSQAPQQLFNEEK